MAGEVILKEKYGSSKREVLYVKPPGQSNLVALDEVREDISSWFTKVFLPQGFPDSVSKDYASYQVWDTAQAFCSTITGTLATQEVLRGVGVGDTNATPLAATITWVIKDGCGHVGKILFAFSHGTDLDAYSKRWRLYADALNDAAMCIEIALPYFSNFTTVVLCLSTVMKAIVGVAGGATRAAMTQHHAIRGNLADVAAKDSAQETAVNLIASITALLIITVFGNSMTIFGIMMILHIVFNYLAVRAVCLRTLNEPRFIQLIDLYLKKEIIMSPCEINATEPIIFYSIGGNVLDLKMFGFQIKVGSSIKNLIKKYPKGQQLKWALEIYEQRNYIIVPSIQNRRMFILLKENASINDILCSYFHATLLSIIVCAINDFDLAVYRKADRPFAEICQALQSAEWSREVIDPPAETGAGFIYEPSVDLMVYLDKIAQKEWIRVRKGLLKTGWDLSKHLVVVDEWRVENNAARLAPALDKNVDSAPFKDILDEIDVKYGRSFTIEPDMKASSKADASTQKSPSKLDASTEKSSSITDISTEKSSSRVDVSFEKSASIANASAKN